MKKAISYKSAGVDRNKADLLVKRIDRLMKKTIQGHEDRLLTQQLGGYASLYACSPQSNKKSSLYVAASTDGVGTKLKLAFESKTYNTIGIDLVAMSVNDLLCVGARPAFFLDYFATGKLKSKIANLTLEGIVEGCAQARCALLGGETAEMPGLYQDGEFDLAGFAVGFVKSENLIPRKKIQTGETLIGLASTGTHSNGYSLIRKLLPKSGSERKYWIKKFLTPTQIYVSALESILNDSDISGMAHITGSGFLNVPRISDQVSYEILLPNLNETPEVYSFLEKKSGLSFQEQAQTWNLGIGMVLCVKSESAQRVQKALLKAGITSWKLGHTTKQKKKNHSEVYLQQRRGLGHESQTTLYYGKH